MAIVKFVAASLLMVALGMFIIRRVTFLNTLVMGA